MESTLEEIENTLNEPNYYAARLLHNNKVIVNANPKGKWNEHKRIILNILQSPNSEDGIYTVQYGANRNVCNFEKTYIKGKYKPAEASTNLSYNVGKHLKDDDVKILAELNNLKFVNERLQQDIDQLTEENESLLEELEMLQEKLKNQVTLSEEPETPLQTAKTMFSELLQLGVPLLDKYFQIQEDKNQILRQQQNPTTYQAPEVKQEISLENKIKAWIKSKENDEEISKNLQVIYFNSPNIQKFAELLNDYNPDLYAECRQRVNG